MAVLFYVNSVGCYISLLFCVVLGIACDVGLRLFGYWLWLCLALVDL